MSDPYEANGSGPRRFKFRFNPEVNVSHILTSFMLMAGLVAGYVSFRADLDAQRNSTDIKLAVYEARLTALEHAFIDKRDEDRKDRDDFKASLEKIQQSLWQLHDEIPNDQKGHNR